MTSNTFQMVNFSVDDLTELISNCVKAELQKIYLSVEGELEERSDEHS